MVVSQGIKMLSTVVVGSQDNAMIIDYCLFDWNRSWSFSST